MPTQRIPHDDFRLSWEGAVSFQRERDATTPWRLPYERRALFPPDLLRARGENATGVRITFRSTTTTLLGEIVPHDEATVIECCCDGISVGTASIVDSELFAFTDLPTGEKQIELWLPHDGSFTLKALSIDAQATIGRAPDSRPKWVTYGSSITQCRAAATPTETWPAIVARTHGLNLTCLGYGGQCHLEPMLARMIRDLPADFLSMCVGINIYGNSSLSPRTFLPAILGFVAIVRERHPTTPFVIVSPIYAAFRETTENAVGFTIPAMRAQVAEAVDLLREAGDTHVHYLDGLSVFGPDLAAFLPDDLHPDAEGYRIMGRNMTTHLAPYLPTHAR